LLCTHKRGYIFSVQEFEFEWDLNNAARHKAKHGVPFELATRAFFDPHALDARVDRVIYGEERRMLIGEIEGRAYAVVYTPRGKKIRLISARKANPSEQRKYHEGIQHKAIYS
jgi:uncharacterized DUF497 family protein